jgi:poly-gamma-glutamate capsule biosynthesis protein CapA/YwtB (metallophosphatase superfamily)
MATISLFLCGDVMTGRGVDQLFATSSAPTLHEGSIGSALDYVKLAERKTGPISRPVNHAYIWGDALDELALRRPDVRIINLGTTITTSEDTWPGRRAHHRMHPANAACLRTAGVDCAVLANNHVLDWGYAGLKDTLAALGAAGIGTAGAGRDAREAARPAILPLPNAGRLLVFAFTMEHAGTPHQWMATSARAGVNLLSDFSRASVDRIARQIAKFKRAGDLVVASLHWGAEWGYDLDPEQQAFAHQLIDKAGVDVIHGHASHHAKGIELHAGKAILYGCGDFVNDYEGIGGQEAFGAHLALMYFLKLDTEHGRLTDLLLVPLRRRHFQLRHAHEIDCCWLTEVLNREDLRFGTCLTRLNRDEFRVLTRKTGQVAGQSS